MRLGLVSESGLRFQCYSFLCYFLYCRLKWKADLMPCVHRSRAPAGSTATYPFSAARQLLGQPCFVLQLLIPGASGNALSKHWMLSAQKCLFTARYVHIWTDD